jgi:hypothetical protein
MGSAHTFLKNDHLVVRVSSDFSSTLFYAIKCGLGTFNRSDYEFLVCLLWLETPEGVIFLKWLALLNFLIGVRSENI